jgi:hypothetical protein
MTDFKVPVPGGDLVTADGTLVMHDTGGGVYQPCFLASGALTPLAPSLAEFNLLDDQPKSATFAVAAGASNISSVTITAKDAAGVAMGRAVFMLVWLCDTGTGNALTSHDTVTIAAGASGADFGILTANKALLVQTTAAGLYVLTITDAHKTAFYVCAKFLNGSAPSVSAVLSAASYGA